MPESPRLTTLGGAAGIGAIQADVTSLGSAVPVYVTLTATYVMVDPEGFPFRPCFTGAASVQFPSTIASGTRLALLKCEADALVTAGAATYS